MDAGNGSAMRVPSPQSKRSQSEGRPERQATEGPRRRGSRPRFGRRIYPRRLRTLMVWQLVKELTCDLFGHEMEIETPAPFVTLVYCSRCGGGHQYNFVVEPEFFDEHDLPQPEGNSD